VFSPYYAWRGRADPEDHCAVNVALYGPRGARWTMTERGRAAVCRSTDRLEIGPSALTWERGGLSLDIREIAAPWPRPVRGKVRLSPQAINPLAFELESAGSHYWRPIAPRARVEVTFDDPAIAWGGEGYFDTNFGAEPLEAAFSRWTWSRAATRDGAAVIYDAVRRRTAPLSLAVGFTAAGEARAFEAPRIARLPKTRWRLDREIRSEAAEPSIARDFEDTPFYSRSLASVRWLGQDLTAVHESLSLDRFAKPIVKCMLPFRMPRWAATRSSSRQPREA